MLDFRARPIHPQSYPSNAGTKHALSPEESCICGDGDEGFDDGCELLVVPRKAAALHDSSECPLNDPSTSDEDETLHP
jgi:hypothetical protein